jgi:hypoxanthine phosphoribosyltransferase
MGLDRPRGAVRESFDRLAAAAAGGLIPAASARDIYGEDQEGTAP